MVEYEGSWVRCDPNIAHPKVEVLFKKKPDYKYPFCVLCLEMAQKRNGTLPVRPPTPLIHGKNNDSKPERDSL